MLYLLGLPIPDDMTGKVVEEAIRNDRLTAHPPRFYKAEQRPAEPTARGPVYSEEEQADIEERLRNIGYL